VTYDEIIDFLIEFNVIAHRRVCSERQITAIVLASFPKVVTKPSIKYNLIFVNLENNSDDVIKEELVRVTTEPIIDPASREAQVWIEEVDEESLVETIEHGEEDEELTAIENKKLKNYAVNQRNVQQLQQQQQQQQQYQQQQYQQKQQRRSPPPPVEHQYHQDIQSQSLSSVSVRTQQLENGTHDGGTPPTGSPRDDATDSSSAMYQERGVDVSFDRSPRFKENLNNNRSLSKSTGELRNGVSIRRNTSFSKKNIDRSLSVIDVAKKFENDNNTDGSSANDEETKVTITKSVSTTNLQRKRSFTKSTNPSFVGSIREKFRSSLRKNKSSSGGDEANEKDKDKDQNAKVSKKDEHSEKKNANIVVKRGASTKVSFSSKSNADNKQGSTKIGPNNDIRLSVNKSSSSTNRTSTNSRFGGSSIDIRNGPKVKTVNDSSAGPVNKSLSNSTSDIRTASFRVNSSKESNKDQEVRASFRSNNARQSVNRNASDYSSSSTSTANDQEKSHFVRATNSKSNDPRSSVRRITAEATEVRSSVRKTNDNRPTVTKSSSSVRISATSSSRNQTARTLTPRENNTAKRTGAGLRRSNSRAGGNHGNKGNSNASSAASTPNISRENSRSNIKIPIRRNQQQTTGGRSSPLKQSPRKTINKEPQTPEEKDILRIAKAFQRATDEIDAARDNVEQFMINVVTEDVVSCPNNRLHIDDLYDHIRHRMIMSQSLIFDGYRSEIRVDMSQYFELFFTALASHMNRVGCEIITDPATQQKGCYLTHIKLIEYTNGVQNTIASEQQTESDDDMQASYV